MKKQLIERFQQLAGIKPLYEQDINDNERFDKAQKIIDEYIKLWGIRLAKDMIGYL